MAKSYDYSFKLILIGDSNVGKSQIIHRFSGDQFSSTFITSIGIDFSIKSIELSGKKIKLQIWDTAGQERFQAVTTAYLRGAMGAMLVYDITNEKSFQNIKHWLKNTKEHISDGVKIIIVGSNCDLEDKRQVSQNTAREFASFYGVHFMEVSAKAAINITEAFHALAADILASIENQSARTPRLPTQDTRDSEEQNKKDTSFLKRILNPIFGGQTKTPSSVPEEITEDPYALDLYEKALRDGTETDRSIRINIVGNFSQGKTSLMRRLLRQKIGDVGSTDGIDVNHYKYHRSSDGKLSFKRTEEKDTSDIIGRLVSVALTSEHTSTKKSEPTSAFVYQRDQALHATGPIPTISLSIQNHKEGNDLQLPLEGSNERRTSSFDTTEGSTDSGLSSSSGYEQDKYIDNKNKIAMLSVEERSKFAKELKKKKSQNSSKDIQTSFDIWDFGGQYVFYATHTLFHSKRAIYLLVVDLSKELDEVVVDKDFPEESNEECMEYFIHFWMNSIHSFVGSEDGSEPTVILVGTHKDKVKGNAATKRTKIEKYFNKIRTAFDGTIMLNHFHTEDFAVDNTAANDVVFGALRDTIIQMGNEQCRTVEIPAKWIHLEKAIIERKHIKIIAMKFVCEIDAANEAPLGDPEQIKLFLRYHHNKGTFIYFDEEPISEYVVLDPQYLIDAFKSIITSERFCTHDPEIRPLWKMLLTDARLEKSLIDKQWGKHEDKLFMEHKDILLAFLTRHHIISEASYFHETAQESFGLGWFVVPSLLKAKIPETEFQKFLEGKRGTVLRFVMLFDNSTIVPTIYHRLTAALIGKWSIAQFGNRNLISKDQCVVRLNVDHAGITEMRYNTIELVVVNLCLSSDVSSDQADIFKRFSEAVVIHVLSKMHRNSDARSKPYSVWYRCNHESHDASGSIKIIRADNLMEQTLVPCPDLMSHDIQASKAQLQWTKDSKEKLHVINPDLTDKVISRVSQCVGKNWQLLGLELGVNRVQIEQITENYPNSVAMRIYYMLKAWCRQMADSANMNVLIRKMQECASVSIEWDGIRNIVDDMN